MSTLTTLSGLSEELDALRENGRLRLFRYPTDRHGSVLRMDGQQLVNLSSNDYLGLADDADLNSRFLEKLASHTVGHGPLFGSTASRLMTGAFEVQRELEEMLSSLFAPKTAPPKEILLFNSGYHANIGILPALAAPGDAIFSDRLNHASLIDGMKLSGATFFRYRHGDTNHLERILRENRGKFRRSFIVTESVFSMDGDSVDLAALVQLKQTFDSFLIVDEAHAFGVLGADGLGLAQEQGVLESVDLLVGTFGKALACQGAFAATSAEVKNYLIQKSRPLIYSTALPPVCTHWVTFLLQQPEILAARRASLNALSARVEHEMLGQGFASEGMPFIQKLIFGSVEKTLAAYERLKGHGIVALPIRPPTVPEGTSRLRLSLRADLSFDELAPLWTFLREEARS